MRVAICLLFVPCALLSFAAANAQTNVWQPSPGHIQIPIWPKEPPDAQPVTASETVHTDHENPVAGKPISWVSNVSRPTMTIYSPKGNNTGVAVVVFPGGGYQELAIDLQGTEICDWLSSRGITAVMVKYRVPNSGPYIDDKHARVYPKVFRALQDAQRTVGLVRFNAKEWHIDPRKIGVIGFSAGGHIVAGISTNFEKRLYPAVDDADKGSCRPDFAIAEYPGHLWVNEDRRHKTTITDEKFELRPDIHPTHQTPPTFLLQAENDDVDPVEESLVYYIALKKAGVPVEMHLYAEGGHAFGLRPTKFPITKWPQLVETWLRTIGMTSELGTRDSRLQPQPNHALQRTEAGG
jgi:acetyl esterase/lipase